MVWTETWSDSGGTTEIDVGTKMAPSSGAVGDPEGMPVVSGLRRLWPNPTSGTIAVTYAIAGAGRVQLDVYDVSGRLVRRLVDGERRAGTETVVWNGKSEAGSGVKDGVYFTRLTGPGVRATRRVILLH